MPADESDKRFKDFEIWKFIQKFWGPGGPLETGSTSDDLKKFAQIQLRTCLTSIESNLE